MGYWRTYNTFQMGGSFSKDFENRNVNTNTNQKGDNNMSMKRGSHYISEKHEQILREFFGGISTGISELAEIFAQTLSDVAIFSKKEAQDLLNVANGWSMDFNQIPAKVALVREFEDWCKLQLKKLPGDYDNDLYYKLLNLDKFSALVICRILFYAWENDNPANIAKIYLVKKED